MIQGSQHVSGLSRVGWLTVCPGCLCGPHWGLTEALSGALAGALSEASLGAWHLAGASLGRLFVSVEPILIVLGTALGPVHFPFF